MNSQRELSKSSQDKKMTTYSTKKSELMNHKSKQMKTSAPKINSLDHKSKGLLTINSDKKETLALKNIKKKIIGNKQNIQIKPSALRSDSQQREINQKIKAPENRTPKNFQKFSTIKVQKTESDEKSKSKGKNSEGFLRILQQRKKQIVKTVSLDNFQIGKRLGKGRFGDVFLVKEKSLNFLLAMKIINKKLLKDSDMQTQLFFQIKIQTFLNHPNTLKMYGAFSDQKNIYLLIELASGGCLFRQLKSKGSFREDQVAYYLRQVVTALKIMHSNSIMHRDIKPQNILNNFGVLKLSDFGWSVYSPLYQRQTFCGTLDYVPPEIVIGQHYDEKVDIWCLGILCYELCTGRAPFQAKDNQLQTYDKILSLNLDFPMNLSNDVVDFISHLLVKQPKKRMTFEQIQCHPWMKKHQNETGRMISKEIWQAWLNLKN